MTVDRFSRTSLMEHLALESELDLHGFCQRFQKALDLPEFEFDGENMTEWGLVEVSNIEYNVSRPYESGTLHEWDNSVPTDCNFGISLIVYREHPYADDENWSFENLVIPIGQIIADEFRTEVHYHRRWLGIGRYVVQNLVFYPKAA